MPYFDNLFSTGYINADGNRSISPSQQSAIVSILSAGTFFGALGSPFLADNIGRRWALIASSFVFVLGVIFQTAAVALPLFLAGRFFAGFGVGLISALIPLYQSETAPKWIRGAIVGAYQFAITIGLLLAAIVDNATAERMDTGSYRIPIAVQFAWAIILIGGMLILPESPRYLIKRGKDAEAARALGRLRRLPADHVSVQGELAEVRANHEYEMSLGKASYLDCFRGHMLKRQLTGMGLQALQQLTGINFIFYYGTQYFKNSGLDDAFIIQVITSVINVVSTLPGLYAVDKFGRRPLLLWGAIGMCVSQFLVAMLGTLTTGQDSAGRILVYNVDAQKAGIAFVCIYIFFFASTWGPLAWVVTGEIFPLKHRARGLSMTTATNVSSTTLQILQSIMQTKTNILLHSGFSTGPLPTQPPTSSTTARATPTCNPRSSSCGSPAASSASPSSTSSSTKLRVCPSRRLTSCTPRSRALLAPRTASTGRQQRPLPSVVAPWLGRVDSLERRRRALSILRGHKLEPSCMARHGLKCTAGQRYLLIRLCECQAHIDSPLLPQSIEFGLGWVCHKRRKYLQITTKSTSWITYKMI